MTSVSHDDLQRSMGRVEGNQGAMVARLDRFEKLVGDGFKEVGESLEKIEKRLAQIETRESERKGAWAVLVGIASILSGLFAAVVTWWLKGGRGA